MVFGVCAGGGLIFLFLENLGCYDISFSQCWESVKTRCAGGRNLCRGGRVLACDLFTMLYSFGSLQYKRKRCKIGSYTLVSSGLSWRYIGRCHPLVVTFVACVLFVSCSDVPNRE